MKIFKKFKFSEFIDLSDETDIRTKYPEICAFAKECSRVYHNTSSALISDSEYDQLIDFLVMCESTYPDLKQEDTPTEAVGHLPLMELATPKQLKEASKRGLLTTKYTHHPPMLGLNKTTSEEELFSWINNILAQTKNKNQYFSVEEKADGINAKLVYEHGELTHLVQRGDGIIGDDIIDSLSNNLVQETKNQAPRFVKTKVSGIPLILEVNPPDPVWEPKYTTDVVVPLKYLEVLGEFVVTDIHFKEINGLLLSKESRPYSTKRSAAAGLLSTRGFSYLTFLIHGVGEFELDGDGTIFSSHSEILDWLIITCGFKGIGRRRILMSNKKVLEEIANEIQIIRTRRKDREIDLDGAVIKVDDFELRKQLGNTRKSPRWAIAYKYPAVISTTTVDQVIWQIGRTGVLTPVALIEPVTISNVVYSRVTLDNPGTIISLDLRRNDAVYIQRSGDVIPKIIGVIPERRVDRARKFSIPEVCPECGTPTELQGKRLYCINRTCPGRTLSILAYAASKQVFSIDAMAVKTLSGLFKCGLVQRPEHLFQLTEEKLKDKYKSTDNQRKLILTSVEKAKKKLDIPKILLSLSIPNLSKVAVESIYWKYRTMDELISLIDYNLSSAFPSNTHELEKTVYWKSMLEYFQYPEIIDSLHSFKEILNFRVGD